MKALLLLLLLPLAGTAAAQQTGRYQITGYRLYDPTLVLNPDSTFIYTSDSLPSWYARNTVTDRGHWRVIDDTLVLNPALEARPYMQAELAEETTADTGMLLTFNLVKRYYDEQGQVVNTTTRHIRRLDFAFNTRERKNLRRITDRPQVRCAFAGYIPAQIITDSNTIHLPKAQEDSKKLYVWCWEYSQFLVFDIKEPHANRFTVNLYENLYADGQVRNEKLLIRKKRLKVVSSHGQLQKGSKLSKTE